MSDSMPSLRCGHCEKLFEYREEIVALREANGGVVAEVETELEAGTVEEPSSRSASSTFAATKRCEGLNPASGPS